MIGAKTYRGALALWWLAGPDDTGLNPIRKVRLIQLPVDLLEVEMLSLGLHTLGASLALRGLADQMLMALDIRPQSLPGGSIGCANVGN
jgi:hypothetical protein